MKSKLDKKEYRDIIYNLRMERKTYKEITEYLNSIGIETSIASVRKICLQIFESKKEKMPSAREKVYDDIYDEELIKLKESGLSVREMEEYYKGRGKEINSYQIRKRLLVIYEIRGERIPRAEAKHKNTTVSNEEIRILSEEGLSSTEIARKISAETGKKISPSGVGYRQEEIYDDNGLERPKVISKSRIKLPEDEVCELRKQGYTFDAIAKIMKVRHGIEISGATLGAKCNMFFKNRNEAAPIIPRKELKGIEYFYAHQETLEELQKKKQELLAKKKKSTQTLKGFSDLERRFGNNELVLE